MTPTGHGTDVDPGIGGMVLHPDPIAEDRPTGERAGRINRQYADPVALLAEGAHQLVGEGGLSHTGRAGQPDDLGTPGGRDSGNQGLGQFR